MDKTKERTSEDIRKAVVEELRGDGRIDAIWITVAAEEGRITLGGVVPSYADWFQAERDAKSVDGVESVQNNLTVRYPEVSEIPTDSEISSNIRSSFLWSAEVNSGSITVDVDGGIVRLTGTVNTVSQKQQAEDIAYSVSGVLGLENLLSVTPVTEDSDGKIKEYLLSALKDKIGPSASRISIEVSNGQVTLSGDAEDEETSKTAEKAALSSPGVIGVLNKLKILKTVTG